MSGNRCVNRDLLQSEHRKSAEKKDLTTPTLVVAFHTSVGEPGWPNPN